MTKVISFTHNLFSSFVPLLGYISYLSFAENLIFSHWLNCFLPRLMWVVSLLLQRMIYIFKRISLYSTLISHFSFIPYLWMVHCFIWQVHGTCDLSGANNLSTLVTSWIQCSVAKHKKMLLSNLMIVMTKCGSWNHLS